MGAEERAEGEGHVLFEGRDAAEERVEDWLHDVSGEGGCRWERKDVPDSRRGCRYSIPIGWCSPVSLRRG